MANSLQSVFEERKFHFLIALTLLLIYNHSPSLLVSTELHVTTSQPHLPPPYPRPSPSRSDNDAAVSSQLNDPVVSLLEPASKMTAEPAGDVDLNVNLDIKWEKCKLGALAVDYIPCLDNWQAIKELRSRRRMEHRERHCPDPSPRCLVPLPIGYKVPVRWPKSRDMIWYSNVPHPKLVEYKKEQNWVRKSGDYFVFHGGGTQFKNGVHSYIDCIHKDEHEAQIQFALERGIPAILSVIGTQKLTFPDYAYDLIHCARCRVHWDGDGGKPLLELNRILRPGGYFIWSATPVYLDDERDCKVWNSMVTSMTAICWKVVAKTDDSTGIGLKIYQKPSSYSCYKQRKEIFHPCVNKRPSRMSCGMSLSVIAFHIFQSTA